MKQHFADFAKLHAEGGSAQHHVVVFGNIGVTKAQFEVAPPCQNRRIDQREFHESKCGYLVGFDSVRVDPAFIATHRIDSL